MSAAFRSGRVAVVRANRWLLGGGVLLALVAIVSAFFPQMRASGALPAGATALACLIAARERRWPHLRRTSIEADAAGVREQGKLLIARERITHGFALTLGDGCLVRLVRGGARRPLDIVVWDEAEGRDLLRALDLDASQTRAEVKGLSGLRYLPRLATMVVTVLLFMVLQRLVGSLVVSPWASALSWLGLFALLVGPAWVGSNVSVGVDGVHVGWLWWSRYFPFSRVGAIKEYKEHQTYGFELELDNGEKQPILISRGTDVETSKLALDRAQQAFQAYREGARSADVTTALARRERPLVEWLEGLRALGAGANADMRTAVVSHDRLWQIVSDPSAAQAVRASAAVALASRGSDEDRQRVRSAAKQVAAPKLRLVLEKTAAEETTDAELCEALAELEAEHAEDARTKRR